MTQMVGPGLDDRDESPAFEPGLGDGELLEAVAAHYGHALAESPAVLGWLVDHGVRHGEVVERFVVGWSDRTLGL